MRRVEIQYWRHLLDKLTVEFSEGANVIEGPNESGKSTIVEALLCALFERPDSLRAALQSIKPKERELKPFVACEFGLAGVEYRIEKTFFERRGHTLLLRKERGSFAPLAQDKDAIARLATLLSGDATAGYISTLWAQQGSTNEILTTGIPEDLRSRLSGLLAGLLVTDLDKRLIQSVEAEWADLFTAQRRTPNSRSEWKRAIDAKEAARKALDSAYSQVALHEKMLSELDTLTREAGTLSEQWEKTSKRYRELVLESGAWDKYMKSEARLKALRLRLGLVKEYRDQWQTTIEQLAQAEEALLLANERAAQARQDLEAAQQACDASRALLASLEAERARSAVLRQYIRLMLAMKETARVRQMAQSLPPAPTAEEMKAIRVLRNNLEKLQIQLQAMGLRVRLSPEAPVEGQVSLDQKQQRFSLSPEDKAEWSAAQSVSIVLEGIASIEIETGMEDAARCKAKLERGVASLLKSMSVWQPGALQEEATFEYAQEVYARLEALFDEASALRTEYERASHSLDARYAEISGKDPEALLNALRREQPEHTRQPIEEDWEHLDSSKLLEKESVLREIAKTHEERARQSAAALEGALRDLRAKEHLSSAASVQCAQFEARKGELLRRLSEIKNQIRLREPALEARRADEPAAHERFDPSREKSSELFLGLTELLERLAVEAREAEAATASLRPEGEEITEATLVAASKRLEQISQTLREKERAQSELAGRVKASADGLHEKVLLAEEEHARCVAEVVSLETSAMAWDLLRAVLHDEQQKAVLAVLDPVKQQVEAWLPRITRGRYDQVELDAASLAPRFLVRDSSRLSIGKDSSGPAEVSFGTREQLSLLSRMALAGLLAAPSERRALVLDDPLVNTDAARQALGWEIILEVSERLQVIVLTCHPVPASVQQKARVIKLM